MLVLARNRKEQVIVTTRDGQRLTITVAEVRGDKVRLAFDAPPEVEINRREVQDRKDRER